MVIKLKKIKANSRTVRFSELAFFYILNFCIYNLEISPIIYSRFSRYRS